LSFNEGESGFSVSGFLAISHESKTVISALTNTGTFSCSEKLIFSFSENAKGGNQLPTLYVPETYVPARNMD